MLMDGLRLWLIFLLFSAFPPLIDSQEGLNLDVDTLPSYLEFLTSYNNQWPFRRLTFIYSMPIVKDASREVVRNETSTDEQKYNIVDHIFAKTFSKVGVSTSSMRLPLPRGTQIKSKLMLDIPNPPAVTLVLFSLESHEATFIRQVAEAGEMAAEKIWWIIMTFNVTNQLLNLDLGLRPDSRVIVVSLLDQTTVAATISRWSGSSVTEGKEWMGATANLDLQTAPKGRLDLSGQRLSVAVYQDYPFAFVDNDKKIKGWFVDIWNELQEKLNFNSTYYVIDSDSSGGSFRRAAEELWLGRADAVIGAFSFMSVENVEFSKPVTTLEYRFYLQRATTSSSWAQYVQPFTPIMWLSVCGILVTVTIFMATSYLIGRHYGIELQDGPPIYNWKESAIIVFGSVLQQGPDYMPNGIGAGLILWSSYVMGVVVYTAYGAALISKLTVRTVDPPFKSLDSFVLDRDYVPYMLADSGPHRLTLIAESGAWLELRNHRPAYVLAQSIEDGVNKAAFGSKATFLEARERVNFFTQESPLNCRIVQIPDNILRTPGRFIFQKNSPFKAAIDQQLLQMSTSGRLVRWRERWMGTVKDNPCPADSTLPKFGLEQVTLPFGILGTGILLSSFILAMEQLFLHLFPHHHHTTRNTNFPSMIVHNKRKENKKSASKKKKTINKIAPLHVEFLP